MAKAPKTYAMAPRLYTRYVPGKGLVISSSQDELDRLAPEPTAAPTGKRDALGAGFEAAKTGLGTGLPYAVQKATDSLYPEQEAQYRQQLQASAAKQEQLLPGGPAGFGQGASLGRIVGENLAYSAPQMGAQALGGAAGFAVGGPVGAGAGVGLVGAPMYVGSNVARATNEGQTALTGGQAARSFAASIPQAAVDVLGARFLPGVGKYLGEEGFTGNLLSRALKGTAAGAITEGGGEALQQVGERYSAGLNLTDQEALGEYGQAAAIGGLLGGGFGAVGGATNTTKIKEQRAAAAAEAAAAGRPADLLNQGGLDLQGGTYNEKAGPAARKAVNLADNVRAHLNLGEDENVDEVVKSLQDQRRAIVSAAQDAQAKGDQASFYKLTDALAAHDNQYFKSSDPDIIAQRADLVQNVEDAQTAVASAEGRKGKRAAAKLAGATAELSRFDRTKNISPVQEYINAQQKEAARSTQADLLSNVGRISNKPTNVQVEEGAQYDLFGNPAVVPETGTEVAQAETTEPLLDKYGQPLPVKTDGNTPLFDRRPTSTVALDFTPRNITRNLRGTQPLKGNPKGYTTTLAARMAPLFQSGDVKGLAELLSSELEKKSQLPSVDQYLPILRRAKAMATDFANRAETAKREEINIRAQEGQARSTGGTTASGAPTMQDAVSIARNRDRNAQAAAGEQAQAQQAAAQEQAVVQQAQANQAQAAQVAENSKRTQILTNILRNPDIDNYYNAFEEQLSDLGMNPAVSDDELAAINAAKNAQERRAAGREVFTATEADVITEELQNAFDKIEATTQSGTAERVIAKRNATMEAITKAVDLDGAAETDALEAIEKLVGKTSYKQAEQSWQRMMAAKEEALNAPTETAPTETAPAEAAAQPETQAETAEAPVAKEAAVESNVPEGVQKWDTENRNRRSDVLFEGDVESRKAREAAVAEQGNRPAHGMSKAATVTQAFTDLVNLLQNGIDRTRGRGGSEGRGSLDTASLASKAGEGAAVGTGTGTAYFDGPFVLVGTDGHAGGFTSVDQIAGVLVNDALADTGVVEQLREMFPNISIETYSNTAKLLSNTRENTAPAPATTETTNAPQEGNKPQGRKRQRQGANEERATSETSGRNRAEPVAETAEEIAARAAEDIKANQEAKENFWRVAELKLTGPEGQELNAVVLNKTKSLDDVKAKLAEIEGRATKGAAQKAAEPAPASEKVRAGTAPRVSVTPVTNTATLQTKARAFIKLLPGGPAKTDLMDRIAKAKTQKEFDGIRADSEVAFEKAAAAKEKALADAAAAKEKADAEAKDKRAKLAGTLMLKRQAAPTTTETKSTATKRPTLPKDTGKTAVETVAAAPKVETKAESTVAPKVEAKSETVAAPRAMEPDKDFSSTVVYYNGGGKSAELGPNNKSPSWVPVEQVEQMGQQGYSIEETSPNKIIQIRRFVHNGQNILRVTVARGSRDARYGPRGNSLTVSVYVRNGVVTDAAKLISTLDSVAEELAKNPGRVGEDKIRTQAKQYLDTRVKNSIAEDTNPTPAKPYKLLGGDERFSVLQNEKNLSKVANALTAVSEGNGPDHIIIDMHEGKSILQDSGELPNSLGGYVSNRPAAKTQFLQKTKVQPLADNAKQVGERAAVEAKFRAELDRLGVAKAGLRILTQLEGRAEYGRDVGGEYNPAKKLITVVMQPNSKGEYSLGHEAIHAMEHFGLILPQEKAAVLAWAKGQREIRNFIKSQYGEESQAVQDSEYVAEAYALWLKREAEFPGRINLFFRKLSGFLGAFKNYLFGRGFISADAVLEAVDSGFFTQRQQGKATLGQTSKSFFRESTAPNEYAQANDRIKEYVGGTGNKVAAAMVIANKLTDMAVRAGIPAARKLERLLADQGRITARLDRKIEDLSERFDGLKNAVEKGVGEGSVNNVIQKMRFAKKWGFDPMYKDADGKKINVDVDPELNKLFNKLSPEAQQVVKDVFQLSRDNLFAKKEAVMRTIGSEYDALIKASREDLSRATGDRAIKLAREVKNLEAKKARQLTRYESLLKIDPNTPYAPIKRFGDFVVVGRSKEYVAAEEKAAREKTPEAYAELRKLQEDGEHYYVAYADDRWKAILLRDKIAQVYDSPDMFRKDEASEAQLGGSEMYAAFQRMQKMIQEQGDSMDPQMRKSLTALATDLYLGTLAESSSRKAEMAARLVHGGDFDMVRGAIAQGRSDARFIGSVEKNGEIADAITQMKKEAKSSGAKTDEARELVNQITARHAANLAPAPQNKTIDKILSFTTAMYLTTSPMFFVQQAVQPFMVSVPVAAARHGYGRTMDSLNAGYDVVRQAWGDADITKPLDLNKLKGVMWAVAQVIADSNALDVAIDKDMGNWTSEANGPINAAMTTVSKKIGGWTRKLEAINRLATGVMMFNLEMGKQTGENIDPEAYKSYVEDFKKTHPEGATDEHPMLSEKEYVATQEAIRLIMDTHGDYSLKASPLFMRSGAGRVLSQFKKFQIMQLSLYTQAINDGFFAKDIPAAEKEIARRTLLYMTGHAALFAGALGLPGAAAGEWLWEAINKLMGRQGPFTAEGDLRKAIGNPTIANLLINGAPTLAGVDLSGSLGQGNLLSIAPYADIPKDEDTYKDAIIRMAGPAIGGVGLDYAKGMGFMADGQYYKGLEKMLPKGFSNAIKAYREATEGVTDKGGETTVGAKSIGIGATVATALGLRTTEVSNRQYRQGAAIETKQYFQDQTSNLKRDYLKAYDRKDGAKMQELRVKWLDLQKSRDENGLSRQPISDLIREPMRLAKREKNVFGGVKVSKSNRAMAEQLAEETGFVEPEEE